MLDLAAPSGRPRAGHGFDSVTPRSARATGAARAATSGRRRTRSSFDLDGVGIAVQYNGVNDAVLFSAARRAPTIRAAIEADLVAGHGQPLSQFWHAAVSLSHCGLLLACDRPPGPPLQHQREETVRAPDLDRTVGSERVLDRR